MRLYVKWVYIRCPPNEHLVGHKICVVSMRPHAMDALNHLSPAKKNLSEDEGGVVSSFCSSKLVEPDNVDVTLSFFTIIRDVLTCR